VSGLIDVNTLLATAAALEQEIQQLQAILAQLEDMRASLLKAIETIEAVSAAEESVLVPADAGRGSAFFYASPADRERFLVHLGMGVYAKLPKDKALEALRARVGEVERDIAEVGRRLAEATEAPGPPGPAPGAGAGGEGLAPCSTASARLSPQPSRGSGRG